MGWHACNASGGSGEDSFLFFFYENIAFLSFWKLHSLASRISLHLQISLSLCVTLIFCLTDISTLGLTLSASG